MTTDSPYVRSDGLEGSFDREMDFIVCSVYELGWTKWGIIQCPDGEIGRHSGLKIRRPLSGRGGSSPPPGTIPQLRYVVQSIYLNEHLDALFLRVLGVFV